MLWDLAMETECSAHVRQLCTGEPDPSLRKHHWQALLALLAPHIEKWALGNRVLRAWNLATEDDARAVMVSVIERLHQQDYANLRRFVDRLAPDAPAPDTDDQALEVVAAVRADSAEPAGQSHHTPFRAWLLTLLSFVAKDHLRARLGWAYRGADGEVSRRDVGSGAARLAAISTLGKRPPITDRIVARSVADEVRRAVDAFPEQMRGAWRMWLHECTFAEIAERFELSDPQAARKLVRAAQARLRSEFRAKWPELVAS